MDILTEILNASDPSKFDGASRQPHPESLGNDEKADWCKSSQKDQVRRRETASFRKKLTWLCRQRLESKAWERPFAIRTFHNGIHHFDLYLTLLEMAPRYKGERGKAIVSLYIKRQKVCRTLMLMDLVMENLIADKKALPCLAAAKERLKTRKPGDGGLQPIGLATGEALLLLMPDAPCHCYLCNADDPRLEGGHEMYPTAAE